MIKTAAEVQKGDKIAGVRVEWIRPIGDDRVQFRGQSGAVTMNLPLDAEVEVD